ncbi:uncharacterized protein BT62DRAFT_783225 [Guyanagaster necrorhizus]|uniref:F-box domain-containing protein n=1 Tax=Guyanagaster necrorhizus TaxID=856835 RepID=A0A9P8AU28_9AGAR|nr:uncharacterized protein BT62DRAFT_783225 [Guyanagaster necrorhizus MCA 3950]KAG7447591.1 hypothetical protein BT62DRAFT_783225 [Guyanagaster necrorhizus MCA 3950]
MPLASLPQELLDIIVDELSQDRKSLCALHSTLRSFRCHVRGHLFRSINLTGERRFYSFLELCTAASNISDFVQSLEVTVFIDPEYQRNAFQALGNHPLPNLHALCIFGDPSILPAHPSRVNTHEIPPLLNHPVTTLTLHNLNIKSARHFRDTLRSCPALQTLTINWVRVCASKPSSLVPETADAGPEIQNLSISFTRYNLCALDTFFNSDGTLFALRGLRKFSFSWVIDWRGTRDLQLLIPATRGTLQELHLCHSNVASYHKPHERSHIVDFSQVPCVIFDPPLRDADRCTGLAWFAECLGSGDGPARIRRLRLSLYVLNFEILLSSPYMLVWSSLERALAAPRLASLEKLKISIVVTGEQHKDQPSLEQMKQDFLAAFPILHEQRRVIVQTATL